MSESTQKKWWYIQLILDHGATGRKSIFRVKG